MSYVHNSRSGWEYTSPFLHFKVLCLQYLPDLCSLPSTWILFVPRLLKTRPWLNVVFLLWLVYSLGIAFLLCYGSNKSQEHVWDPHNTLSHSQGVLLPCTPGRPRWKRLRMVYTLRSAINVSHDMIRFDRKQGIFLFEGHASKYRWVLNDFRCLTKFSKLCIIASHLWHGWQQGTTTHDLQNTRIQLTDFGPQCIGLLV